MDSVFRLGFEILGNEDEKQSKMLFFKSSQNTMKSNFSKTFFWLKCSLESCAICIENIVSMSILGLEKFASQV